VKGTAFKQWDRKWGLREFGLREAREPGAQDKDQVGGRKGLR
jgi:hypothetical protein